MAIRVNLDVMLAKRKMSVGELAERVGITPANVSVLKNGGPRPYASPCLTASARRWSASRAMCWSGSRSRSPVFERCVVGLGCTA